MKKLRFSGIIIFAAVIAFSLTGCPDKYADETIVPTNLVATATSSTSIVVSWPMVSGALQYYVYSSLSDSSTYTRVGVTTPTDTGVCSYTVSGLSSGTTYYFKVSSYNSAGESSQSSYISATTLIGAPTNVSATAESSSSITVSWSQVSGATGYNVYSSTSASGTFTMLTSTYNTSYTATGLSPNTTYYFKVSAYDSARESSQSSYTTARTLLDPPDTPRNVSATAGASNRITVSWSAVSGAAAYYVYYSTSASGTYTQLTLSSSTSYTMTGASNTTYYFKVSSYNSAGESSLSSYASATARY